VRHI